MKKLFALLVVIALASVLAACAPAATPTSVPLPPTAAPQIQPTTAPQEQPTAASTGKKKIVYVTPLISMSPDWNRSHQAFLDAAQEFGFEGKVVGPNEINVEQMVADIETAIADKADGIITCPLVPDAFVAVLKKAKDAGIPVVNAQADCCSDSRLAFIGTDAAALGKSYADKLTEKMQGKANIGVIMTDDTTPNQKTELEEFKKGIAGQPGMKVVDIQYDHSQKAEAVEKSAAMLTAHPEIDAIICIEGACPGAVATALVEKNLVGKVTVIAIDLQPDTIQAIKDGVIWAAFTQSYYDLKGGGRTAAKVIVDSWAGKKPASDIIDSGSGFYTKENVDQYGKEAAAPASTGKKKIVYVTPLISMSPDWNRSHQAFLDAAQEFGFEGKVVGPNEINVEQMVADIETAIADKADGIITCPLVPDAFEAVLKKAKDAGIPVVNAQADCCSDSRLAFIGTDAAALGKSYADKLTEKMQGKANIGVIMTDDTTPNQKTELEEFKKGIAGQPGMKVVDIQYDHSQKAEAVEKSAAMLTAHPEIDAIICIEGACPGAVATTLVEKNLVGKVTVIAIDLQPDTIQAIKDGVIWAAFTQSYYDLKGGGRTAAKVIVDSWAGKKPASDIIDSGSGFYTKENVDQYGKEAAAPAPTGKKKIVYVTPLISMSPDWNRSHQAFLDAAQEFGFEGKVVGPNEINVEQMVADIETAIADKADGIITCPLVPDAFEAVLKKAKDAGIPVVNAQADCCSDSRLAFIGTDAAALGKSYADKLTEKMQGKANIGVIMTDDTTPNQKTELEEFKKGIAGQPGMKVVDIQYDHSQKAEAVEKSAAMLTAHPEIDAIICIEGACPGAVATTLVEKNLVGKVTVIAIDLQPDTIQAIKDGVIWAAFVQSYYDLKGGGRTAAKVIVDSWAGKKPASDIIDSGSGFYTKENVDQYGK